MTNTKHAQALTTRDAAITELRTDIALTLDLLATLLHVLTDLASTRQTLTRHALTDTTRARLDQQARLDRAAARGQHHRNTTVGQGWMNTPARLGTGTVPAPVTMSATSATAEIHATLQHWVTRLARKTLPAIRTVTATGLCPLNAADLYRQPPTSDGPTHDLITHLGHLVTVYAHRPDLTALARDLTHLEDTAATAIDGPARTPHPGVCPWCSRPTLVVHHRALGRAEEFIRCDTAQPCECAHDSCPCHRNPGRHRHEWVNSGRATNTWTQLKNLQNKHQENAILETAAQDALARVTELHAEVPLLEHWTDDCAANNHESRPIEGETGCATCPPTQSVCAHCLDNDGWGQPWPCPTITAIHPDADEGNQ